jgi:uncharacterized membrane protein
MPSIRVLGVVPSRPAAEQVVGNLRLAGFGQDDVSFIVVKPDQRQDLQARTADQTGKGVRRVLPGIGRGAAVGLVIGAAIGFALGSLEYFSTVLPQGVLIAACGLIGLIVGALSGAFSTETQSNQVIERYGMELRAGQAVVAVEAPDEDAAKVVEEVLNTGGAVKVNSFLVQDAAADNQAMQDQIDVTEVKPRMQTTR